jgi:hypothetical protein
MEYLGAWGTLIHEKKLRSKISCQTPFKFTCVFVRCEVRLAIRKGFPDFLKKKNGSTFCLIETSPLSKCTRGLSDRNGLYLKLMEITL